MGECRDDVGSKSEISVRRRRAIDRAVGSRTVKGKYDRDSLR